MSRLRAHVDSTFTPQTVYNTIHRLLLQSKLSHYKTKSFARHDAFGRVYDGLVDLTDSVTEKLIGYSDVDPSELTIGTIVASDPRELGINIIVFAKKLEDWAEEKEYCDIENLAQELSGLGAQLKYLSRFS